MTTTIENPTSTAERSNTMGRPQRWFNEEYNRITASFQMSGNLPPILDQRASKLGVTKSDLVMHMIVCYLWCEFSEKFQSDYIANRDPSLEMPAHTQS